MTRFQVCTETHAGQLVYVLKDMQSGGCARIVPGIGANCMELRLAPGEHYQPVAIIDDLQFVGNLANAPSRYGIPVLFPWASGVGDGEFAFEGKRYPVKKPGHTSGIHHGFVNTAAWRVVRSDCDNTGAWVTCAIDSTECGDVARAFPSHSTLEMTWTLAADHFSMAITARNTGGHSMPMGFGVHPFFTIPLGTRGSRGECRLQAAVGRQWDLDATVKCGPDDPMPTHTFLPHPEFNLNPAAGVLLGKTSFNHVFEARLNGSAQRSECQVLDPANQLAVKVTASRDFGTWVFFSPADRNALALEPWTMAANGFNLKEKGIEGTGVITMKPGESWSGDVKIQLGRMAEDQAPGNADEATPETGRSRK